MDVSGGKWKGIIYKGVIPLSTSCCVKVRWKPAFRPYLWWDFWQPHFHSEVQHRPFPQRGRSPSCGNGRKAWSAAPGRRGSGPGTAVVPSVCRLSGLSGQRNASAGAGRVRPGAGRAQPDRSPDGRGPEIHSTPFLRAGGRRSRGLREGGPCAAPRRASGSPAPGADARSGGPAPVSPPRR